MNNRLSTKDTVREYTVDPAWVNDASELPSAKSDELQNVAEQAIDHVVDEISTVDHFSMPESVRSKSANRKDSIAYANDFLFIYSGGVREIVKKGRHTPQEIHPIPSIGTYDPTPEVIDPIAAVEHWLGVLRHAIPKLEQHLASSLAPLREKLDGGKSLGIEDVAVLKDFERTLPSEKTMKEIGVKLRACRQQVADLAMEDRLLTGATQHEPQPAADEPIVEDEEFWREYLGHYLDFEAVRLMLNLADLRGVESLVENNVILAVPTSKGMAYPAFQFLDGRIDPTVSCVIKIFSEAVVTPYTTASWLRGVRIEERDVMTWLGEGGSPERVIEAARDSAARLML